MLRAVLLVSAVCLGASVAGQVVIDMPPPPQAAPAATAPDDAGLVALARYAQSRRAPSTVQAPAWRGVYRPWHYGSPWYGSPWWGWHPFIFAGHGHHVHHDHHDHITMPVIRASNTSWSLTHP